MRVLWFLPILVSCAGGGAGKPPEIERTERPADLSGEWNDVDADLVASEIIDTCFKSPWVDQWTQSHAGKKPTLRLEPIKNKTVGYINYKYFTKQIESALLKSGKVDVVRGPEDGIASSSDPDAKPAGPPSDLVVNGVILSQDDQAGNQEVRAYLTSIEIVELATQKKLWEGQKRIRKLISR
jgi:hypothetical protein